MPGYAAAMGPLEGFRVIEMAGIGPGPYAAMLLADMGAEVIRIEPAGAWNRWAERAVSNRGRRSVGLDLKHPEGKAALLDLVEQADALVEGFRPGVMERLGIGRDECSACNPRLVFRAHERDGVRTALLRPWPGTTSTTSRVRGVLHYCRLAG